MVATGDNIAIAPLSGGVAGNVLKVNRKGIVLEQSKWWGKLRCRFALIRCAACNKMSVSILM